MDDMLQWVNDLRTELKSGTPFGALPDTAKEQFEKFQVKLQIRSYFLKKILEVHHNLFTTLLLGSIA